VANDWQTWVCDTLNIGSLIRQEVLQSLWGGHGQILRLYFAQTPHQVILKRILPPTSHSVGERRKRRSYEVEIYWYQKGLCPPSCRTPRYLGSRQDSQQWLLLLEDLQMAEFSPLRTIKGPCMDGALRWLAGFHASTLHQSSQGLWEQGTYWHFATRREEWQRMPDGPLKELAPWFDQRLRVCPHQCLLHGDAKPANFLWNKRAEVAAVDFQYVGQGCGIREVAYLLSCFVRSPLECEKWLSNYTRYLREALPATVQAEATVKEWLELFPVAWCDLLRFEQGWSGTKQLNELDRQLLDQVTREARQ
jgi:hypothetical protein